MRHTKRMIKSPNSRSTLWESMGPDGKIRGTASQIMEKYMHQAHECQDSIKKENLLQMADHYRRLGYAASQSRVKDVKVTAEKKVVENQTQCNDLPQPNQQSTDQSKKIKDTTEK